MQLGVVMMGGRLPLRFRHRPPSPAPVPLSGTDEK